MPTVRPKASLNTAGVPVYRTKIPAEVTLDQAAVAMAVCHGSADRARLSAAALPAALRTFVELLLAGDRVAPPTSLVYDWRERLIAEGVYPRP